jgi:hypothetical protein
MCSLVFNGAFPTAEVVLVSIEVTWKMTSYGQVRIFTEIVGVYKELNVIIRRDSRKTP